MAHEVEPILFHNFTVEFLIFILTKKNAHMRNILLSLFKGYSDTCPTDTPLENIVEMIRCHAATAERTEKHRYYLRHNEAQPASREKKGGLCFAVSVRFSHGKRKADIREWTQLCMVDFDHVPPAHPAGLHDHQRDGHSHSRLLCPRREQPGTFALRPAPASVQPGQPALRQPYRPFLRREV